MNTIVPAVAKLSTAVTLNTGAPPAFHLEEVWDEEEPLWNGSGNYASHFIYALIESKDKRTLLAFTEARVGDRDGDEHDLVMKRRVEPWKDGTWEELVIEGADGGAGAVSMNTGTGSGDNDDSCWTSPAVVMNEQGHIFLFYAQCFNDEDKEVVGPVSNYCDVFYRVSTDDGFSWGARESLPPLWPDPEEYPDDNPEGWTTHLPGPGRGIQLKHGQHAGRLVVPVGHRAPSGTAGGENYGSDMIYSDDEGGSWTHGDPVEMGEIAIVEYGDDGIVYLTNKSRQEALSTDGGETFSSPVANYDLPPTRGVDGDMVQDSDGNYFFSQAMDQHYDNDQGDGQDALGRRYRMIVRMSPRDPTLADPRAMVWPFSREIYGGKSTYSAMATDIYDNLYVLWGQRETEFAVPSTFQSRRVVIARMNKEWIRNESATRNIAPDAIRIEVDSHWDANLYGGVAPDLYDPRFVVDGVVDQNWSRWLADSDDSTDYCMLEWDSAMTIDGVDIWSGSVASSGDQIVAYDIDYWDDASNAWSTVASVSNNQQEYRTHDFDPVTTTHLRMNVTDPGTGNVSRLIEFEVSGYWAGTTQIIRDNGDCPFTTASAQTACRPVNSDQRGDWTESHAIAGSQGRDHGGHFPRAGGDYVHDGGAGVQRPPRRKWFRWKAGLPEAGRYDVYMRWTADENRATNAVVIVKHDGTRIESTVDQTVHNGIWVKIADNKYFGTSTADHQNEVWVLNKSETGQWSNGVVVADAVKFVRREVLRDNQDAELAHALGEWSSSQSVPAYHGIDYLHDNGGASNQEYKWFRWKAGLNEPGYYDVYLRWAAAPNRATNAFVIVKHDGTRITTTVDQTADGGAWIKVADNKYFGTSTAHNQNEVYVVNQSDSGEWADGYVVADAVKFVRCD